MQKRSAQLFNYNKSVPKNWRSYTLTLTCLRDFMRFQQCFGVSFTNGADWQCRKSAIINQLPESFASVNETALVPSVPQANMQKLTQFR